MKSKRSFAVLSVILLACSAITPAANAFYNPLPGRWLNRDPIGERGGVNIYQCVKGNPVNAIDPVGKETFTCGGTVPLGGRFGPYTTSEGGCSIIKEIFPYAYRCFREGKFGSEDEDDFFTAIQIKTRTRRQCPCRTAEDLGETYYNCQIPGPPGVFIQPDLRDFRDTFPDPGTATDFGSKFCDGAIAAFGN